MPVFAWLAIGALAGSQVKDGFDFFTTDDDGNKVPTMAFWALAAFGGWMLWKKVR